MYNYQIGYYSYEDSLYISLMHEQKFTDAELTEMIAAAMIERMKDHYTILECDRSYLHNFSDFMSCYSDDTKGICDYLVKNNGFKRLEYELMWSCFGWASVFEKTDWEGHDRDDHLAAITAALNKAGYTIKDDTHYQSMEESRLKREQDQKEKSKEKVDG